MAAWAALNANHRILLSALAMYSADHHGSLPPNNFTIQDSGADPNPGLNIVDFQDFVGKPQGSMYQWDAKNKLLISTLANAPVDKDGTVLNIIQTNLSGPDH